MGEGARGRVRRGAGEGRRGYWTGSADRGKRREGIRIRLVGEGGLGGNPGWDGGRGGMKRQGERGWGREGGEARQIDDLEIFDPMLLRVCVCGGGGEGYMKKKVEEKR